MFEDIPHWWFKLKRSQPVDLSKLVIWLLFDEGCHRGAFSSDIFYQCVWIATLVDHYHHLPQLWLLKKGWRIGLFFCSEMLVYLNQYPVIIRVFSNGILITNTKFSTLRKVIVWKSIFYLFQPLMWWFYFYFSSWL